MTMWKKMRLRIALLIAAHNEAAVIGETIRRAFRVGSAGDPVFVIADRCQDDTAERARCAGARVYERRDGPAGKGAAIAWFLKVAAADLADIEAVMILDADSRLRPGSLAPMVRALEAGAAAAQAFVRPAPQNGSPTALLAAYSEWLSQTIDDRVRRWLGWPVPLRGTGMAIRRSVLQDLAPMLRSRVEDVELTLLLVLRGHHIAFVPDAVVEDPKPLGTDYLARQRARWLQGQREVWRRYGRDIVRLLVSRGPGGAWLLSALLLKPRTMVAALKALLFLVLWPLATWPLTGVLHTLVGLSLLLDGLYYAAGLALVPSAWRWPMVRALLRAPLYLIMWMRALVWSLTSREAWLRARD